MNKRRRYLAKRRRLHAQRLGSPPPYEFPGPVFASTVETLLRGRRPQTSMRPLDEPHATMTRLEVWRDLPSRPAEPTSH